MRVSVIIPTYNRQALLRQCLAAIAQQAYADYEVIVVDDASTDGTGDLVRREFAHVRYLRQPSNVGPTVARNRAIAVATGDLLAFTDDDCVPPPHWLGAHAKHFEDPRVGVVGGPLAAHAPSFYDKFYSAHYREEHEVFRRIDRLAGWERLVTGNMSVPRSVLDRVGIFDEQFRRGSDADLTRRICRAGYAVVCDPALRVEHWKTYTMRSFLTERFHKASGSVMTDVKEGTVRLRRFVPVLNIAAVWKDWRNFQAMFASSRTAFVSFWALALVDRWVEVAGRAYYYWTVGRHYRPAAM